MDPIQCDNGAPIPDPIQDIEEEANQEEGINKECVVASVLGMGKEEGSETSRAAAAIWFAQDSPSNTCIRMNSQLATAVTCEAKAILKLLKDFNETNNLLIKVGHQSNMAYLTTNLEKMEDRGWLRIEEHNILKAIVAVMRRRKGRTMIQTISPLEKEEGIT